jgi:hypothetical protein
LEEFEKKQYPEEYSRDDAEQSDEPVRIGVRRDRRDINSMEMYPRRRRDDEYSDERERPQYRDPRTRYIGREKKTGTIIFIATILVLCVGAFLLTYVFNKATITITPKYSDINDFRKSIYFTKVGNDSSGVPYTIESTSVKKSRTLTLSETRKVEAKASGKITIYNNSDADPQKLIKNTRFESAAGKIYRINQSVTVPGKTESGPGTLDVTVYADSYGADYNINTSDFVVVGFKGTPREKSFYAKSKGPITGGSSGNVSLASLSDVNAAKDELALELAQDVKAELMKIKKEGYIGLYGAAEITYTDNEDDVLRGQTSVYEVTATGYVMFADAKSLASSIAHSVRDYANEDVRLGYNETLSFTRKTTDKIASSTSITLLVEGKPRIIWQNDKDKLQEMFLGKDRDEFKPIMKNISSVESAEISFSPMWLSSFPSDKKKIAINESLPKR